VSYSQLVQFSLNTAHNSLRKAIADLCKISPLRVVDIHVRNHCNQCLNTAKNKFVFNSQLSSAVSPGPNPEREGIDVWFVLLEVARLTSSPSSAASASHRKEYQIIEDGSSTPAGVEVSNIASSRPSWMSKESSMGDAYRRLVESISQKDVQLRLRVTSERDLVFARTNQLTQGTSVPTNQIFQVVHISRNSLQMASEATHPVSRSGSGAYRFLRATYTAGSMAGLGFSMAILGICIGIFLGKIIARWTSIAPQK
jgi:hypothetical protein